VPPSNDEKEPFGTRDPSGSNCFLAVGSRRLTLVLVLVLLLVVVLVLERRSIIEVKHQRYS
jgi:hypothetical protein